MKKIFICLVDYEEKDSYQHVVKAENIDQVWDCLVQGILDPDLTAEDNLEEERQIFKDTTKVFELGSDCYTVYDPYIPEPLKHEYETLENSKL